MKRRPKRPVRLSGTNVTRVSGLNAKFIIDNGIGVGAIIRVLKRGEVIPHVEEVIEEAEPTLPDDKYDYEWDKNKVHFVLTNAKDFDDYHVKRIVHFFKTIGVEYFSSGLVQRFMGYGYDTISKILKAKQGDLLKIEGIQEKMAQKIYTNIHNSIQNVPLSTLMDATGVYKNLGERRIQMVLDKYPNVLFEYTALPKNSLITRISDNVSGYNTLTATAFVDGLPKFEKWLQAHPQVSYETPKKKAVVKTGKLSGQIVVFTGFRSAEMESKIKKLGGEIGSGVSSKTTILVVKDNSSGSGKTAKAKSMGIKIMDAKEMQSMLDKS